MQILLAEDEHDVAVLLSIQMQARGHQIFVVTNGEECTHLYRSVFWQKRLLQTRGKTEACGKEGEEKTSHKMMVTGTTTNDRRPPFDAVILDHRMPKKDGLSVAADILKLEPEQRIIFVSAYVKEHLEKPLRQLRAEIELVQKPVRPITLIEMIEDKELYEEFEKLGGNAAELRQMNPSHKQLKQLVEGLRKFQSK